MEGYTLRIPPGLSDTFMNALFLESHSFQSVFCCHSLTTVDAGQTVLKKGVEPSAASSLLQKNAQFRRSGRHAYWLNWPIESKISWKPFSTSQLFFVMFQKHPIIKLITKSILAIGVLIFSIISGKTAKTHFSLFAPYRGNTSMFCTVTITC